MLDVELVMDEQEAIDIVRKRIEELEAEGAWGSLIELGSALMELGDIISAAANRVSG